MNNILITLLMFITNSVNPNSITTQMSSLNVFENLDILSSNATYQLFLPIVSKELQGYFVSPDGSDSNPGTFYLPWKTIGKAAQMVRPGDTVYIRGGIYIEAPRFTISGTETKPIKILAYPGETAVVDGKYQLPVSYRGLVSVLGDWIFISGLEIRNSKYGGLGLYGKHNTATSIFAHHCQKSGIYISGDYGTIKNCFAWRNSIQNEFGGGSNWSPGITAGRDSADGVTEAAIMQNNIVWENWGEGISTFEANGTVIEDNISHDNYSTNIYISDSINVSCQRNFVYMNPDSYVYGYGANGGIMMGDEKYNPPSVNITIINNIAYGNQGNFWWWQGVQGGGMNNVLVANNTFVNGIGDPDRGRGNVIISRGDHVNVRFENNLVRQDGELPVIATRDHPGITYSHNLWSKLPYDYVISPSDIIDDPKLVGTGDPYSADWYTLSAISPAIGKALSLPEVIVDYFGNSRGSLPDMGAIEYLPD
jgi:hypothetical protein